jgi:hypothetical protein
MSRFLLASDLDRTLIHPARTLPEEQRADSEVVEIYEGREITVAARAALVALRELHAAGAFVPVTTRSRAQLERVTPVWLLVRSGYAVCANGATVLLDGRPDADWVAHIDAVGSESASPPEVRAAIERELGAPGTVDWMASLRTCDGHFLYATVVLDRVPRSLVEDATQMLAPLGWRAVLHGRKLYALPWSICKGAAIEHVAGRLEVGEMLAAGDSELDVELLEAAGERWCPVGSELIVRGLLPARTQVTQTAHAASGAEIAARAVACLRASPMVQH